MHITDVLGNLARLAEANPVLLLALLLGIGSAAGAFRIRGIGLGPAAVLFTALALSAADPKLALPPVVGALGLAFFAYTVGLSAGPMFFAALRTGGLILAMVVVALGCGAVVTVVLGRALSLSGPTLAGVFAGSLTNTPALAAASEQLGSPEPTVGYSVTYVFGVLGMIIATGIAGRGSRAEGDAVGTAIERRNVRVDQSNLPDLGALSETHGVVFSRIMVGDRPGHPGRVAIAVDHMVPQVGDILTVVGSPQAVDGAVRHMGHPSSVALTLDRSALDIRRITVSAREVVGHTIGELQLERRFGATATRLRRGDVDVLAADDLVLISGDRLRVVAPPSAMIDIARLLGDSERQASEINPIGLGLGITLGLLVGALVWPLPRGVEFSLGTAGGPLLVGLLLGRLMRSGPVVWALPHHVSATLNQLGMLLFLAYAGSTSGPALASALSTDQAPRLLLLGIVVTSLVATIVFMSGRYLAHLSHAELAGTIAGAATQPAALAHAIDVASGDSRTNLGYALVYPIAMITKVVVAPLIGLWA